LSSKRAIALEGLYKVRDAALLLIIANALAGIGTVALYATVVPAFFNGAMIWGPSGVLASIGAGMAVLLIALLAGLVLSLIAVYTKLIPGSEKLAQYRPLEFETPYKLIRIGYVAGLVLLIAGIATLVILIGIPLTLIGIIMLIIGVVGAAILLIRLHDVYRRTLLLVAGILLIVGIFVPLAGFVGWVLAYADISSLVKSLEISQHSG